MATIPTFEALGSRPTPQPSRGIAKYNPGIVSQATTQLGRDVVLAGQIIQQTNDKFDEIAAEDAYNRYQEAGQNLALGDDGFTKKKGGNATGQTFHQDEMGRLTTAGDSIESSLQNDNQKALFQRRRSIYERTYNGKVLQHQASEGDAFAKTTHDGTMATEIRKMGEAPSDNNAFNGSWARMEKTSRDESERNGYGRTSEVANEMVEALREDAWKTRIMALADSKPKVALAYLEEAQNRKNPYMSEGTEQALRKVLEESSVLENSQKAADVIYSSTSSPSKRAAMARKIVDPKERRQTLALVKAMNAEDHAYKIQGEGNAYDYGLKVIADGGIPSASLMAGMSGAQQLAIQNRLKGDSVRTDWGEYDRLEELRLSDPEAFKKVDIVGSTKLATAQRKYFIDAQNAPLSGMKDVTSYEQQLGSTFDGAGLSGTDNTEIRGKLKYDINNRILAAKTLKGKELTWAERQDIIDEVLIDNVKIDKTLWVDSEKRVSALTPEEIEDAYVEVDGKDIKISSVPASDRAEIIAERRSRGEPITEQIIVEEWVKLNEARNR